MAISLIKATTPDDTRGVGDGHEEIVETFEGGKGYCRSRLHLTTTAIFGVKHP